MEQNQAISTEDSAFNSGVKTVDRVFDITRKIMSDEFNKQIKGLENPIKLLMTEAYVEGYKSGNAINKNENISYMKGRQSAFKESIDVMKGKVKDEG